MRARRYMADQYEGNAEPDLELYAHYGHTAYAHKASQGVGHVDTAHARRSREAHKQGLTVVHYGFADPDVAQNPEAEARLLWAVAKWAWAEGDYLAIDLERLAGGSWERTAAYLARYWDELKRISGHDALIYANTDYLKSLPRAGWLAKRRIWQADYNPNRGKLPWRRPVWACQYTDGQRGNPPHSLAGIGECDVSLLRLDVALVLDARFRRRRRRVKHQAG